MNKLAWSQLVMAFTVGACMGWAMALGWAPRMFHHHGDGAKFQQRLLDRFSSKLQLTPEQRHQVAAILEAKRQKIDALRAETRPRFEAISASMSSEIRQLLTPEQQQRFDAMEATWNAQRERRRTHWMESGSTG